MYKLHSKVKDVIVVWKAILSIGCEDTKFGVPKLGMSICYFQSPKRRCISFSKPI